MEKNYYKKYATLFLFNSIFFLLLANLIHAYDCSSGRVYGLNNDFCCINGEDETSCDPTPEGLIYQNRRSLSHNYWCDYKGANVSECLGTTCEIRYGSVSEGTCYPNRFFYCINGEWEEDTGNVCRREFIEKMFILSRNQIRYGEDPNKGIINTWYNVNTRSNFADSSSATWCPIGLWKSYLVTQDQEVWNGLKKHVDGMWTYMKAPNNLFYTSYNFASGPSDTARFRADHSILAFDHWGDYKKALDTGMDYQLKVNESSGRAVVVFALDHEDPSIIKDSSGYGIPGMMAERLLLHKYFETHDSNERENIRRYIKYLFKALEDNKGNTGLHPGNIKWENGDVVSATNDWINTQVDTINAGLQLGYILKDSYYHDLVKSQTDSVIKYAWIDVDSNSGYFVHLIDTNSGKVLNGNASYHTEWEWGVVLLYLWKIYDNSTYRNYADKLLNYMHNTMDNQSAFELARDTEFAMWFYHLTGDVKYKNMAKNFLDKIFNKFYSDGLILSSVVGGGLGEGEIPTTKSDAWVTAVTIEAILSYEYGILFTDDFGYYPAALNMVFPSFKGIDVKQYQVMSEKIFVKTENSGITNLSIFIGTNIPTSVHVNGKEKEFMLQEIGPEIYYLILQDVNSPANIEVYFEDSVHSTTTTSLSTSTTTLSTTSTSSRTVSPTNSANTATTSISSTTISTTNSANISTTTTPNLSNTTNNSIEFPKIDLRTLLLITTTVIIGIVIFVVVTKLI